MFKKILIANRGEIACRVIATARRMGIKTVAVYSDADADARHVREADEAVLIGPPQSAKSYLVAEKIIKAARDTGAEAIHPGYGFLSEKADFARAVEKAGLVFIGPGPDAIAAMGDKIESKKLAKKAGVNTIPGHMDVIVDADEAVKVARKIGYPVMIKASAGGGGKGMRVAKSDAEAKDGFRSATSEARSSFGDERVFIEKFIEQPRHIEIQVLGDSHGNVVYLGERECSIQRRNQKVIEEAPSTFIDAKTRKAMGEQAVALAKAVNYRSAGTVEFVVGANRDFYFLEVNTRLQVEHPVTEFVTGLDLVELMIRIAAGEKLPFAQKDVKLEGWAIEARVYAEDPFRNFLPSIGRLTYYRPPEAAEGVRIDTGVYEGAEISMFYDPLIAKLITYGSDRAQAVARMRAALDRFYLRGVSHNIAFLSAVLAHPRFVEGRLTTGFVGEEYPDGFHPADVPHDDPHMLAAVAAFIHQRIAEREAGISGQMPMHGRKVPDEWVASVGPARYPVTVSAAAGGYDVMVEGKSYAVRSAWQPGNPLLRCDLNGKSACLQVERLALGYRLAHGGVQADIKILTPFAARLDALMPVKEPPDLSKYLLSPMPGLLVSVAVEVGQEVRAGEELAVVEAMKMENMLRAERDGVVAAIHAKSGDSLAVDQKILEFE
ncbi:MAG TPA: acetyl/propionyl/methylcrotonyl-CoA carboxylase subunit alpha [Alphaproteobacteria bacterium]|nr:acetyl/propionyl/methylcrotonyl-CoA carboxylase subunit alpha [Alphaproteobacteria bacterium]